MVDNVITLHSKKRPEKGVTLAELQIERQHLSRQMLDLIRAKNEVLEKFNNDIQLLSMEMVQVVGRQSEIDDQLAKFIVEAS